MIRRLLYGCISLGMALTLSCGQSPTVAAGGAGGETTNGLSACVRNADGSAAVGASVHLRRADYLSTLPALGKSKSFFGADAWTDSNGRFEVSGIDRGRYCIEVSNDTATVLFTCEIDANDTLNLGTDTLRQFATIVGTLYNNDQSTGQSYVQMAGLERLVAVGVGGHYRLTDLPEGLFSLHIGTPGSGAEPTVISNVPAVSTDTSVVPSPLPAPWQSVSIGNQTPSGGAMFTNDAFTISGGGPDIWDTADGFQFVYQKITGNATITVRTTHLSWIYKWAKASVMVRNSLDAGSVDVFLAFQTTDTAVEEYTLYQAVMGARTSADDTMTTLGRSSLTGPVGSSFPYWLRLSRQDSVIVGSISNDGTTWEIYNQTAISMDSTIYFGFGVTSHSTNRLATAVFDSVSIY